jgi:hypothetical protein
VNKAGTHCRTVSAKAYLPIRVVTWHRDGWMDFMVSVDRKPKNFSVMALECFLGRKLRRGETVEHVSHVRTDHSESNLKPRFKSFQAASRRVLNVSVTTNTPRVFGKTNANMGNAYMAHIRIYTPDGVTLSIRKCRYFWFSQYESQDEALANAIAWQQKYRLETGMIYD